MRIHFHHGKQRTAFKANPPGKSTPLRGISKQDKKPGKVIVYNPATIYRKINHE